jgi:hypothetical protein
MKLKEIIKTSADLLGLKEISLFLSSETTDLDQVSKEKLDKLIELSNLVISELSCTYVPMVFVEKINVISGKINFTDLKKKILRVLFIKDENGNKVDFTCDYVSANVPNGNIEITYECQSDYVGLDEQTGYKSHQVSKGVLSYGVCAEFCLTERRFDEAVMWNKRYVDAVKEKIIVKNSRVKSRRWQ